MNSEPESVYQRVRRVVLRPYHAVRKVVAPPRRERHLRRIARHERRLLARARAEHERLYASSGDTPLVTVTIATWNRGPLLVERTLPSVFAQTYENWEVVIVGDQCTDETETLVRGIGDPRVRFVNLPVRGNYPTDQRARWQVAGTMPINEACRMARGLWLAQLDDDDVFTRDHIEVLLRRAQSENLEVVCGIAHREVEPGRWEDKGGPTWPGYLSVYGAALVRSYLRFFEFDIESWKLDLPGDKHRHHRMLMAGVRIGFLDRVVLYSPMRPGQTRFDHLAEDRERFG
jgi:glycosyltransferase involved in cell wall biosynthesis